MVAKRPHIPLPHFNSLNLAKIHMVAKQDVGLGSLLTCLNLAKIHMVAKLVFVSFLNMKSLNLAKIHMVAKHRALLTR